MNPELEHLVEKVTNTILAFPWWDYGMDSVHEADPEYALHLARHVVTALEDTFSR